MTNHFSAIKNKLQQDSKILNLTIDDGIIETVDNYKKLSVLMRWFYRAFTDKQILDKANAVNYHEMIKIIESLEAKLPEKVKTVRKLCYVDPDDEKSLFPQYEINELINKRHEVKLSNKQVETYVNNTLTSLKAKLAVICELNDVTFYKGKVSDDFLKNLRADCEAAMNVFCKAIYSILKNMTMRTSAITVARLIHPSRINPPLKEMKKTYVELTGSKEELETAVKNGQKIKALLDKLSYEDVTEFLEKHPNYTDNVTLTVISEPVIWQADHKTYDKISITTYLNDQLRSINNNYKIKDFFNTEYDATNENNLTLTSNTPLQLEILKNLESFSQSKCADNCLEDTTNYPQLILAC